MKEGRVLITAGPLWTYINKNTSIYLLDYVKEISEKEETVDYIDRGYLVDLE